jgi:rubrerythrin
MKKSILITCPKCGHMIKGRSWRCPGCGGSDINHQTGEIRKSYYKFRDRVITALRIRIKKDK